MATARRARSKLSVRILEGGFAGLLDQQLAEEQVMEARTVAGEQEPARRDGLRHELVQKRAGRALLPADPGLPFRNTPEDPIEHGVVGVFVPVFHGRVFLPRHFP